MAAVNSRPLVLSEVFSDTRRVVAQNATLLFLLSFAVIFPFTAAAAWLRQHPALEGPGFLIGTGNYMIGWLVQVAPSSFFLAVAAWITAQTLEDRSFTSGQALREGLRFTLPVLIVQALFMLGMVAGMVLIVVPGVILALMWIFATSALVVERLGITEAFGRSRAVTKGHRWTLLGLLVAATVIIFIGEWLILKLTAGGQSFVLAVAAPVNAYGVIPLISALTSPISMVGMTAIFLRLRHGRHGSADITAEVFA